MVTRNKRNTKDKLQKVKDAVALLQQLLLKAQVLLKVPM